MYADLFAILILNLIAGAPGPGRELRATFIGNAGFHLTDGAVAVLTDFPYESGAFGYMSWEKGTVPSGPRPLCIFSHGHADHFAPGLVREFCRAILGPKDVLRDRPVDALAIETEVRWEGIKVRPVATSHGEMEHYSFLLEWGGKRLYFTGDTEDTDALLAARNLDVAFVSPWLLEAVHGKGRRIDARRIVVYHHRADEEVAEIQGRRLPRQGEVLIL